MNNNLIDDFGISKIIQNLEQKAYRKARNLQALQEAKTLLITSVEVAPSQAHVTILECVCGTHTNIFTGMTRNKLALQQARQKVSIWQTALVGNTLPANCELIITTTSAQCCATCIGALFE